MLQTISLTDLARVGTSSSFHQVMDQVVVPARACTRHPDGKYDHHCSNRSTAVPCAAPRTGAAFSARRAPGAGERTVFSFSGSIIKAVIPTRIPKLIQRLGVANESCVML